MKTLIVGVTAKHGLAVVALFSFSGLGVCQEQGSTQSTTKAKNELDEGETARKTGDLKAAVEHYRRTIELDPDDTEAHDKYIRTSQEAAINKTTMDALFSGKATPEQKAESEKQGNEILERLKAEYRKWAVEHPDRAGYQWGLGELFFYHDPKAALSYFQASVRLNPKLAAGYMSLSLLDEARGGLDGMREDLRKAVEAAPNDPQYLFYYANAFKHSGPKEHTRLSLEVVNRFPDSERAAQALYWLAAETPTESEKLHYLEMLRDDRAPDARNWRSSGLTMLFAIYMQSDFAKALALAQEQVKADPDGEWKPFVSFAQAMVDADQYLKGGKAGKALKALDPIKLPNWAKSSNNMLALERAQAFDANKTPQKAYDTLLKIYAAAPTDEMQIHLVGYGKKLGKNDAQVQKDIWAVRVGNSRPAVPLSLPSYSGDKPMTLADFSGHVILLNFWYPFCGPCRGEFPYIQAVLDKYKDQGFEIVAVNVSPEQDELVLPLLKGFKLGFIPLKGTEEWASSAYKVRGEPTNFLIGADGRIYLGPLDPVSDPAAQRTLELQVEALVRAKQAEKESKPTSDHAAAAPVGLQHE